MTIASPEDTSSPPRTSITPVGKDSYQKKMEVRKFKDDNTEIEIPVHVILVPEDWPEASSFPCVFKMQIPHTDKGISIPFKGLSLEAWETLELKYPNPYPNEKTLTEDMLRISEIWYNKKFIDLLEISSGKSVPGKDSEEKVASISRMFGGAREAISDFLMDNMARNKDGILLDHYNNLSGKTKFQDFTDFECLTTENPCQHFFRINRPFEDHVTEFPLKSLAHGARVAVEDQYKMPTPPKSHRKKPDARPGTPLEEFYNDNDVTYLANVRLCNHKRLVAYLDQCLPFTIPGSCFEEKIAFVRGRLCSDVRKLKMFFDHEMISFQERMDFL